MKLIKLLFTLMLVSAIAFSCKSDKKEAAVDAVEEAAEETDEAVSETADAVEEGAEATSEEAAEAAESADEATEEATEEVTEVVAEKKITVVFPRDTKLQNEVKTSLTDFAKSNPKVNLKVEPKIVKIGSRRVFCITQKTLNSASILFRAFAGFGTPGPSPIVNFPSKYYHFRNATLSQK